MVLTKSRIVSFFIAVLSTLIVILLNITFLRYLLILEFTDMILIMFCDLLIVCTWIILFYSCKATTGNKP
ncbi:hypothetical protein KQ51_01396 [Candidatus Izimaplasma bacterium HR1]|jgi:hypothetical protein|nr:hypothetical protein KQ51_01396 [Candidatus Izimaplasma bacterium HR1]